MIGLNQIKDKNNWSIEAKGDYFEVKSKFKGQEYVLKVDKEKKIFQGFLIMDKDGGWQNIWDLPLIELETLQNLFEEGKVLEDMTIIKMAKEENICNILQSKLGEGWVVAMNNQGGKQDFYATYSRHDLSTKHTYIWFDIMFSAVLECYAVVNVEAEEIAYGDWYNLEPEEIEDYKKLLESKLNVAE